MIKNYFKIAFRSLGKNKAFSVINIAGLAIGISCFILIALYVTDELSFDRFNKKAERIYRISADIKFGGPEVHYPLTSDMMGGILKKDFPEIEDYTRIYTFGGGKIIKKNNQFITEDKVAYVDSTFFNVFTLPAVAGDTKTALNELNAVVITASTAKKYFGSANAIGKTIQTSDKTAYKVTAVIKDIPSNSHFNFNFLFSMKNADYQWGQIVSHNFYTYLLLKPGTDVKAFEKKSLDQYVNKYVLPEAGRTMGISSMEEFERSGNKLKYILTPMPDIHLHSDRPYELSAGGNIQYIYIFSLVAVFILLIACINFMNLTTARSAKRAKEVGIRKVLGTDKRNLIARFLSESVLMAMIATLLAIAIVSITLPLFNNVAGKNMDIGNLLTPMFILFLLMLPFIVGLVAGSYPAFFLSSFKPVQVLKGRLKIGGANSGLRSGLVVFQFVTSIVLIIGTIIIYRQLNYIQSKNLGYSKDQVLIINDAFNLGNNAKVFKQEMLQQPGVLSGTLSGYLPTPSFRNDNLFSKSPQSDAENGFTMQEWSVDYDYINTLGMELVAGRNFSKTFGTDSSAVILNETAAKGLGYDDPIGKPVYGVSDFDVAVLKKYTIIGVVKDFHFESLKRDISKLGLFLENNNAGLASFKINGADASKIINAARQKWKALSPEMPFSYKFMDAEFNHVYDAEQRVGTIALTFAILAIVIACLGLFGLAAFVAEQRTKEIGVRKVLGASTVGLAAMLSKDFLKLVIISSVVAFPLAWWGMHTWLQDFAYRVDISWWIFIAAGTMAILIALITVSFQAVKAAMANPVKSLRTE